MIYDKASFTIILINPAENSGLSSIVVEPMLEILPDLPDLFLAVISCWLGLSLLLHAPRDRASQAFAWFCANLALYGLTSLLPDLTSDTNIGIVLSRLQLATTVITPWPFYTSSVS